MPNLKAIDRFIEEFQLRQPEGTVGFAAKVKFHINGHTKTRYTEVQILKGQELDTIYLINPDLPFEDLPDTFMSQASEYRYIPKQKLEIHSLDGEEFVEIFPVIVKED